jgi:hypothetical protein
VSGEALAHGVTPPWCLPAWAEWEDLADDRAAAALLGVPLADDDDLTPPVRPVLVPPAAIPIRRPAHLLRHTAWRSSTDPSKEHARAA